MPKLKIDLPTLRKDDAELLRTSARWVIAQGDQKVVLEDGDTIIKCEYGIEDLAMFLVPGIGRFKKTLQDAMYHYYSDHNLEIDVSNPGQKDEAVINLFATEEYKQELTDELEKRRAECRALDYPDIERDLTNELDATGPETITNVMETSGGLVIGSDHRDSTASEIVIEALESNGVSLANGNGLIFVEEINSSVQPYIDSYYASAPEAEMPAPLYTFLDSLGSEFVDLVAASKRAGARVYGIDTSEAKVAGEDKKSATHHIQRCAKMNAASAEIIENAKAAHPGQGFVALVGEAHINTHEGGVPGLAQLLNVPGLSPTASGKFQIAPENRNNRGMPPPDACALSDAILRKLAEQMGGDPNALADWRDQEQAARDTALSYLDDHPVDGEIDLDALLADQGLIARIEAKKDEMEQRATRRSALKALVDQGDLDTFRTDLAHYAATDPLFLTNDLKTDDKGSLLTDVIAAGHADLVQDLVDAGAPIDDPEEADAVFSAILTKHSADKGDATILPADADQSLEDAITAAMGAGIPPNGSNRRGETPLQKILGAGATGAVGILLQDGADSMAKTADGKTMMMVAAENAPDAIAMLVHEGASIDARSETGTILQDALRNGNADAARALLLAGADVNRAAGPDGQTELHLALAVGDPTLIDDLVIAGADPARPNADGVSALDVLLLQEVSALAEEATNGPHRAVLVKNREIDDKNAEIAATNQAIADLNDRADHLSGELGKSHRDAFDKMQEITQITTIDLPALQIRLAQQTADQLILTGHLPALEAANPMHAITTQIDAQINGLRAARAGLGDAGKAQTDRDIAAAELRRARLNKTQPLDPELIQAQVTALKATLTGKGTAIGTIADVRTAVATDPDVTTSVTTLAQQLIDRQSQIMKVEAAVMAKDYDALDALLNADPSLVNLRLPGLDNARTLIQHAAVTLDVEMVNRLVAHGADLHLQTKTEGTAIHELFDIRRDDDDDKQKQTDIITSLLAHDPTIIDVQDRQGSTGLHLACLDGNADALTELLANHANEDLRDARGWTAKDVVVVTTKPIAERAYAAAADHNVDSPLIAPVEINLSTVEILMRATICEEPSDVAKMRDMFEGLYADPLLRPVLDLAARDAANAHEAAPEDGVTATGLRIAVAKSSHVGVLYNQTQDGNRQVPKNSTPFGAYEETHTSCTLVAARNMGIFQQGR